MTQKAPVEERFRYIGFDVFPKQARPLFETPEEEKEYLEKIRHRKFKFFFLERQHSLIEQPSLTTLDRTIILVCSVVILIGFFLFPIGGVYVDGIGQLSVSGLQFLANLGNLSTFLALADRMVLVESAFCIAFVVLSLVLGVLQLVTVLGTWRSGKGKRVSLINRLGLIPVLFWAVAVIMTLFSVPTPVWGFLGTAELGPAFNIARLLSITGWGVWVIFAALVINSSIVGD